MKVGVWCSACMREFTQARERGEDADPPPSFVPGEMRDSGVVFVTCTKNHRSAVVYNHHKYEVLFHSGTAALEDGYSNEAVSTIAAALERAYEFFFRVVLRKRGLTIEQVDAAWKHLARQSERQFGAFCTMWLLETQKAFPLLPNVPEFRNQVIHRGYIPTPAEVHDFARSVFELIKLIVGHLQTHAAHEMSRELLYEAGVQHREIPDGMPRASMAHVSISDATLVTFDQWLDKFREIRAFHDSYRQHVEKGA